MVSLLLNLRRNDRFTGISDLLSINTATTRKPSFVGLIVAREVAFYILLSSDLPFSSCIKSGRKSFSI